MVIPTLTLKLSWTAFLNLLLSRNLDSCYHRNLNISPCSKKKADDKLLEFEPLSRSVHF